MKTKSTLFVTVLAAALFGVGCASVEITEEQLQEGIVAHYHFNGNAKDETTNALHGTLGGALPTLDRAGEDGGALKFNGVSDYIKVPHSDVLNVSEGLTISVWLQPDSWEGAPKEFLKKGSSFDFDNNSDFGLATYERKLKYGWHKDRAGMGITSVKTLPINEWFQIAVVHDSGKSIALYINGGKVNFTAKGHSIPGVIKKPIAMPRAHHGNSLWFGLDPRNEKSEGGRNRYSGSIDDVRIYNRALSAEEVKALYDLENPKTK